MIPRLHVLLVLITVVSASIVFSDPLQAQTRPKDGECEANEVDMGDYCASLPPAITEAEKKRRRVTRFRGESMMPGKTDSEAARPVPPVTPVTPAQLPLPVVSIPDHGFIVQLGAFSTQEMAESIALTVATQPGPVRVISLERSGRLLWACILGPFESRGLAVVSRDQVQQDTRFKSAYIKLMDPEIVKGITNDNTKK
jgi:cell division septation protein DedD